MRLWLYMVCVCFYLTHHFSFHLEFLEVDVLRVAVLLGLDVAVVVAVGHIGATDVALSNGLWLGRGFSIGFDLFLRTVHFLVLFI